MFILMWVYPHADREKVRRILASIGVLALLAVPVAAGASDQVGPLSPEDESFLRNENAVDPATVGSSAAAASAVPVQPVVVSVGADAPPVVEHQPEDTVVGGASRADGAGWFVTTTGAVHPYGGASHHGDLAKLRLNEPIVAMAATPSGKGYWLVASDGGIFTYGDAVFHGSTGDLALVRPIVDIAATPDGGGYLLAADDGGVFAFGNAAFRGSMGHTRLNQPIVGISLTAGDNGYWLVARDGGIFAFGHAPFYGSTGATPPGAEVVDIVDSPDGAGYWLVTESGQVLPFGDAPALAVKSASIHGVVVGAVRRGAGMWLTLHPATPTVYAWQSGGFSNDAISGIIEAANNAGAIAELNHIGTLGVHDIVRDGTYLQRSTPGWSVAFTARAVDPSTAAVFHGSDVATALQNGHVVMSRASADIRGARVGDVVVFSGWDLQIHTRTIGAIVPGSRVSGSELTFGVEDAKAFGFDRPSSIWIVGMDQLSVLETQLSAVAEAEQWVRWSRSWDASGPNSTLGTTRLKQLLGEFEYRPTSGDYIEIDPRWVESNIVRAELPILGRWRCHRAILPALTAALAEIEAQGLAGLIDVADSRNGGCWVARQIRGSSGGAISRHAWGLAVDLNPSSNPFGGEPTMDLRIVEIFRANGFAWGGTWSRPDGMHFEWVSRPR